MSHILGRDQIEAGMLKEGLISVGSRRELEEDLLDPEIIKRFNNHFRYRIVDEDYYMESEAEDAKHYRHILLYQMNLTPVSNVCELGGIAISSAILLAGRPSYSQSEHYAPFEG